MKENRSEIYSDSDFKKWENEQRKVNPDLYIDDFSYDFIGAYMEDVTINPADKTLGNVGAKTGKILVTKNNPLFDKVISQEIALGNQIIELEDEFSVSEDDLSLYSIDPKEINDVDNNVNRDRYDPDIKFRFNSEEKYDLEYMNTVRDWAIENPFNTKSYAEYTYNSSSTRSAEIRKLDSKKYMDDLMADAISIRKKQLVENAYKPAVINQYIKDSRQHGDKAAQLMPAANEYKKITGKNILEDE